MERRGKSSPDGWEQPIAVNSIRSNAVGTHTGRPGRVQEAAGARQQWRVEIDGCLKRQNPAYRLACTKTGKDFFPVFMSKTEEAGADMYFSSWKELEKLSPLQNGRWDRERLYEYLVQSCWSAFRESIDRFFADHKSDRELAGLLLDFLLDEDYDGSDSQMGAAHYLSQMDREVLRAERERLLLAQANPVFWKRPFPQEEALDWL